MKIGNFRTNEHNHFSGHVISEIPTATPIFSTMPNSTITLLTLTDIRQQQKTIWPRLNRKYIVSLDWHENNKISMATPTFSTMPVVDMPRSTWPDAGRHRGQKIAAIQTGSGNNRCRATLDHVVSGTCELAMVENVGVSAEIASPALSVQKLFIFPVSSPAIINSGSHHRRHSSSFVRTAKHNEIDRFDRFSQESNQSRSINRRNRSGRPTAPKSRQMVSTRSRRNTLVCAIVANMSAGSQPNI